MLSPTKDANGVELTPAQQDARVVEFLDQMAYFKYDDPARLRMDGGRYGNNLPVMQTWHGEAKGTAYWKTRQDAWAAKGMAQYFIPYFAPGGILVPTLFDNWDGSLAGQADDVVDGLHNFSGWASLTDPHRPTTLNHQYDLAADSRPGMDAMSGCGPVFNRHSGPTEVENRILGNFEGFTTWISCLQGLVADNPRFIEFSTWNDYLEGSYLGGPYPRSALWANFRGNDFSHDAFREIGRYYLEWFKTGRQPQVTNDLIAIAHRPHPMCAPGPHPGTDGSATCAAAANDTDNAEDRPWPYTPESTVIRPLQRQAGATSEDDMLYGAVILMSPGRVTLTSGATTKVFDLPAGVSQVPMMPFAVGSQSIKLERSGALVAAATSAVPIVARPNVFNYNVATAHARGPSGPITELVTPTEDSLANAGAPATNFGSEASLSSRGNIGAASYLRYAIPATPPGKVLTSAKLSFRTTTLASAGATDAHTVALTTGAWTEAGLTWNNRPAINGPTVGTITGATAVDSPYSATLDTAQLSLRAGTAVSLTITSTGTDSLWLWSRDHVTASYRPTLALTYNDAP